MASFSIVIRPSNLNGRLRASLMSEKGLVRADVQRRARRVRDRARDLLNERSAEPTGKIASSIRYTTAEPRGEGRVAAQVGSDLLEADWVERGTGVYGPHATPIVPRRAKVMVFESRMTGGLVWVSQVRGQPGKHYLRDALQAAAE